MKLRFIFSGLLLLGIMLAFSNKAQAQVLTDLPVVEFQGTWEPISGTRLTSGDDSYASLTMPFPFTWDNQNISYVSVNCNGYMTLGWTGTYLTPTCGYYYAGYNTIAPFGRDGYTRLGIYYKVDGVAPKRVLTIQWDGWTWYYYSDTQRMQAQVKLYEGTNSAAIIYGPGVSSFTGAGYAYIYFTGSRYRYYGKGWNIQPKGVSPTESKFIQYNNIYSQSRTGYLTNANNDMLVPGYTYMLGSMSPKFTEVWPPSDATLVRGFVYGNGTFDPLGQGDELRPRIQLENVDGTNPVDVHYTIDGPISFPVNPNYHVIYDATHSGLTTSDVEINMTNATAPLQDPDDNKAFGVGGILNLQANSDVLYGGLYNVTAYLTDGEDEDEVVQSVNIAYNLDLEVTKTIDPKSKNKKKYPLTAQIPVKVVYTNRGITPINTFDSEVWIYDEDDNEVYNETFTWEAPLGQSLQLGQSTDIIFPNFPPRAVGEYRFECEITLPGDEESMDNTLPWRGQDDLIFLVAPEIEAEALTILRPNNENQLGEDVEIFVGRPIQPIARFKNNGITDISDAPSVMTITKIGEDQPCYENDVLILDIPQGMNHNTTDVFYDDFVPPSAGSYKVCVEVMAVDDDFENNNMACDTFEVIDALNGTYTIGPDRPGTSEEDIAYNSRNFLTVQLALDEMYLRGLTGPVVFEFTTTNYTIGCTDYANLNPAMDLRAKVIGMSDVNTVTFRPSTALSVSKGAITLNLYSGGGIGVLFGQTISSTNLNAVVNEVGSGKKAFANPTGKFYIDGGEQKALKFVMHSNLNFSTAFYLSQGASNVSLTNCIIENSDAANSWQHYSLPLAKFSEPQFIFDADSRQSDAETYTAGIMMRSIPPIDKIDFYDDSQIQDINNQQIDTLVNQNNLISNNEISGFAYGIVSLGIGPVLRNGLPYGFYNHDNTISNNYIKNVSKAGIYLGHENNTTVSGNKISGVANSVTGYNAGTSVAGIELGGLKAGVYNGYNNMNISILGNEISNVGSQLNAADNRYVDGIRIEQCKNTYQTVTFPNDDENMLIANNAIWGLVNNNATANRFGIRIFTSRNTTLGDWYSIFKAPIDPNYNTVGDRIVNNTIVIPDDGFNTSGIVAGISVQNSTEAYVHNNAIAMLDNNNAGNTNQYAAIMFQGVLPFDEGGIDADRNIFWVKPVTGATDSAAICRYIQTDENSVIINEGTRSDFLTMNQWQMYSGEEFRSVLNNFTVDLTTPDINAPLDKLRINNVPEWPKGSALNNRAERLDYVLSDIDGNARGGSGQRPDIGAFEFPGVLLNSDIEITTAFQPGAYKSSASSSQTFSEAEYIMTTAPVEVKAELRNNGSLSQSGIDVTVRIYRQQPRANYSDPTLYYDTPELEETVQVTIPPAETFEVAFNLDDMVGKEFYPVTYGEWFMRYTGKADYVDSMYNMPAWFSTMKENVTPLYRIVISVRSDEDNYNNTFEKICRFYIKKSQIHLLLSAEHSSSPYSGDEENAGRRNYDSLVSYFEYLGWENNWNTTEGVDTALVQYFDVFERTAWEPRAVNYTMYNSLFWSDGDDDALTRLEVIDLQKFVDAGNTDVKHNLVIGSQEMVRENYALHTDFVEQVLSAQIMPGAPTDPMNGPAYYAGAAQPAWVVTDNTKWIEGVNTGRLQRCFLMQTGIAPFVDPDPVPGLMTLFTGGEGQAQVAYRYNPDNCTTAETTMGVQTATLTRNVLLHGVDWRHFGDGETILRAALDFLENNDGKIIPVELLSFDADVVGARVELAWETASEYNSDRFEVERAELTEAGKSVFTKIAVEDAAGKSNEVRSYGPVVDADLAFGSTYVYRLKMVDLDGQYEYSSEVEVTIGEGQALFLSAPVPNPVKAMTQIQFSLDESANVELGLYDVTGKLVKTLFHGFAYSGVNTVDVDASDLTSGSYTYVLKVNDRMLRKQLRVVK